jgi:hypothetical protein
MPEIQIPPNEKDRDLAALKQQWNRDGSRLKDDGGDGSVLNTYRSPRSAKEGGKEDGGDGSVLNTYRSPRSAKEGGEIESQNKIHN